VSHLPSRRDLGHGETGLSAEGCWNVARVDALACVALKADAALAEEHAARAMRFLQRAADAGYFAAARVEHLRQERDLAPTTGARRLRRAGEAYHEGPGESGRLSLRLGLALV